MLGGRVVQSAVQVAQHRLANRPVRPVLALHDRSLVLTRGDQVHAVVASKRSETHNIAKPGEPPADPVLESLGRYGAETAGGGNLKRSRALGLRPHGARVSGHRTARHRL